MLRICLACIPRISLYPIADSTIYAKQPSEVTSDLHLQTAYLPRWAYSPQLVQVVKGTRRSYTWRIPKKETHSIALGTFLFNSPRSPFLSSFSPSFFWIPFNFSPFCGFFQWASLYIIDLDVLTMFSASRLFRRRGADRNPAESHVSYEVPLYTNAAYYPNWRIYRKEPPSSLRLGFISHVFYAFAW